MNPFSQGGKTFFEKVHAKKNGDRNHAQQDRCCEFPESDEDSDSCQNPDHGRRCNPNDDSLSGQDHPGPDESYPGDHLANDPAGIDIISLEKLAYGDINIGPEADEATGAYACRLP